MDNTKIKNLKPFKNLFSSYYEHFLKSFFQWMSRIFIEQALSENISNGLLNKKCPKR